MKRIALIVVMLFVCVGVASADCVEVCLKDTPCEKYEGAKVEVNHEKKEGMDTFSVCVDRDNCANEPDIIWPAEVIHSIATCDGEVIF